MMRKAKAAFLFYRLHATAPVVLSILGCALYHTTPDLVIPLACKLASDVLILYLILAMRGAKLYYFYNLHLSRTLLLISFFLIDFMFLGIGLWITYHFL